MNILHVVDQISQKTAGGSAKCPYQLSAAQAKLGHNVSIFTSDYNAKNQEPPPGVKMVKFKSFNFVKGFTVTPSLLFGQFMDFDIAHLHNYRTFPNLIAANQGMPFVLEAHGNAWPVKFSEHILAGALNRVCRPMVLRGAKCCIANSDLEVEHYRKAEAKWIEVINPGIDLTEFVVSDPRHSSAYKTVLYLGRLDYNKGVDILIDAFALLNRKDTQLKIAGVDYGYRANLEAKVERFGLLDKVNFVGPLYGREKAEAYRDADLFVMPSRSEIWGLTFMEALATGTPCIMTEGCGPSSVLPVKCGRVVKPEAHLMAYAIGEMLDEGAANFSRDYRKQWVSQFSWDVVARKTISLYHEVLNRCRK